jgi:hypothetical protein
MIERKSKVFFRMAATSVAFGAAVVFLSMIFLTATGSPIAGWFLNGGFVIWRRFFGPDLHSLVWLFSVFGINVAIYSCVAFIVQLVLFVSARRPEKPDSS